MANIDEITSYILDQYKAEAKKIEDEAQKKASIEIDKANKTADAKCEEIISEAKKEAERKLEAAHSSARQICSKEILKIKNQAISDVLEKAKSDILNADLGKYEDFLISLLKKYHEGKSGEIVLSMADGNKDMPKLKKEAEALGLDISKEKSDISGGFIIKYGNTEQNCSVDAIFKEKKDELVDYINSNLFVG